MFSASQEAIPIRHAPEPSRHSSFRPDATSLHCSKTSFSSDSINVMSINSISFHDQFEFDKPLRRLRTIAITSLEAPRSASQPSDIPHSLCGTVPTQPRT